MKKEWKDLLVKSFDEPLNATEAKVLDTALKTSTELRKEKEELLKLRALFASFSVETSSDFANTIMDKIQLAQATSSQKVVPFLSAIYPKAIAACLLVILGFMLYLFISEGTMNTEILIGLSDLSPEEAYSILTEETTISFIIN